MENRFGKSISRTLSPLAGRIYYLDVKPSKKQSQIKANLLKMGAHVEEFLSKDVNFLITDRQDGNCPSRNNTNEVTKNNADLDSWFPDTPLSGVPSPAFSRLFSLENDIQFPESPVTDSFRAHVQTPVQSRGQALLERSVKHKMQKNGSADVLEISRQWGIKILSLGTFLEQLKHWLHTYSLQKNNPTKQNPDQKKNVSKPFRMIQLTSPFIKVQDTSGEHRPFYRQLEQWPELHWDSPPNSVPPQLSLFVPECDVKVSKHKPFEMSSPKKNVDNLISLLHKTKGDGQPNKKQPAQKAKQAYCEICGMAYTNLSKHMQTKTHAAFMIEETNFQNLQQLVSCLPTAQNLMCKKRPLPATPDDSKSKQTVKKARSAALNLTPNQVHDEHVDHISETDFSDESDFVEASRNTKESHNSPYLTCLPFCHCDNSSSEIDLLHNAKRSEKMPNEEPDPVVCLEPPAAHQASVSSPNNTSCDLCEGELEPLDLSLRQSPDQVVWEKPHKTNSTIKKSSKHQSEHLFFSENAQVSTLGNKESANKVGSNSNQTVCFSKIQFDSYIKKNSDCVLDEKPQVLLSEVCEADSSSDVKGVPNEVLPADRQVPDAESVRKVLFQSSPLKAYKATGNLIESTSSRCKDGCSSQRPTTESFQAKSSPTKCLNACKECDNSVLSISSRCGDRTSSKPSSMEKSKSNSIQNECIKAGGNSVESTSGDCEDGTSSSHSSTGTLQSTSFLAEGTSSLCTSLYNYDVFNSEQDATEFSGFII